MVEPSVSTDASRLTIALRFAIRLTPMARVTVTTAGSPSGIAATARATEFKRASLIDSESIVVAWTSATTKTATTAAKAISARRLPSSSICSWSGVGFSSAEESRPASLPTSECIPVPVTTSSARPRTSVVFM